MRHRVEGSGGQRRQRCRACTGASILSPMGCASRRARSSRRAGSLRDAQSEMRLSANQALGLDRARRSRGAVDSVKSPLTVVSRPPLPRCRTLRNPFCAHTAGRSFHSTIRVSPSCRARDIGLSTSRRTSRPHAIPWTVHNPHSRCSRIQPSHSTLEMAEAPAQCPQGDRIGPLCCVCGDMWGTLSPPYSCESLDCVEGGDV